MDEEQIKKLELKRFIELIPARSRRSLKRGFTVEQKKLLEKIDANEKNIRTQCRDMVILPRMIGLTLKIYNGKEWVPLIITGEMVGRYLGEFSLTRKGVAHSAAGVGATRSSKAVSAR